MFKQVIATDLPAAALLRRYIETGDYTDCFATQVPIRSSLPNYVAALYTTPLFKAERLILKWLSIPSTDEEAQQVADGSRDSFAAWNVEDRADDQLLLIDIRRRTGSWFMHESQDSGSRLYFGSVVFRTEPTSVGRKMRWTYRSLLGFHRLYSRALLSSARSRLLKPAP